MKLLLTLAVVALVTACAAIDPSTSVENAPAPPADNAATMGYHGPVYRSKRVDGPN